MRINILQHTPSEGPGMILDWAATQDAAVTIYHPYQFGKLPTATDTDLLVILGGPMSPNDDLPWIAQERTLIRDLFAQHTPVLGVCFGAQQIVKVLGGTVQQAPAKEVGWAPVYRQSTAIPRVPAQLTVLHWHEEMFTIPTGAQLLFSSDHLTNQGFVLPGQAVGLQFHLEPQAVNVREMVANDGDYLTDSVLQQSAEQVITTPVPAANRTALYAILDALTTR
ncbi:type 1 glutamine amidotransferase [Levilactobacillus namurensis]|uniref:Type 1 glutamine amidotransferase n=1 Tax=Levilactobacillus namurensis TaxID=380393 RepID=A0AAW8W486_9LACO|nr:type 1 glutamine amidotransferase [Levilactobacillus namurensis]MDT7013355.1 type 1 glutamine amidotransferase [Levilactobacillus namurensis]